MTLNIDTLEENCIDMSTKIKIINWLVDLFQQRFYDYWSVKIENEGKKFYVETGYFIDLLRLVLVKINKNYENCQMQINNYYEKD